MYIYIRTEEILDRIFCKNKEKEKKDQGRNRGFLKSFDNVKSNKTVDVWKDRLNVYSEWTIVKCVDRLGSNLLKD